MTRTSRAAVTDDALSVGHLAGRVTRWRRLLIRFKYNNLTNYYLLIVYITSPLMLKLGFIAHFQSILNII